MLNKNFVKIVSTIEARMTSTRLPGKVLMIAGGKPLLQILIERLTKSRLINEIIVATTINKEDDVIIELCKSIGIKYFRGSENNVLERVCGAARSANADILVQITGDCPLIDPKIVDEAIEIFLERYPENKLISNTGPEISMPAGFDVQVYMAEDLYEINDNNPDELEREHVSYAFYKEANKNKYRPYHIKYKGELNRPDLRVTLDYESDYKLIRAIYEELSKESEFFSAVEIIKWIDKNSGLMNSRLNIKKK
ncbi:MAG: hypothetical protein FJ216_11315 [Ignavibacteria bacterium]|nr:hypothetical protein [Ignavibacteria bacterium]